MHAIKNNQQAKHFLSSYRSQLLKVLFSSAVPFPQDEQGQEGGGLESHDSDVEHANSSVVVDGLDRDRVVVIGRDRDEIHRCVGTVRLFLLRVAVPLQRYSSSLSQWFVAVVR